MRQYSCEAIAMGKLIPASNRRHHFASWVEMVVAVTAMSVWKSTGAAAGSARGGARTACVTSGRPLDNKG